jgi:hypothetical protein
MRRGSAATQTVQAAGAAEVFAGCRKVTGRVASGKEPLLVKGAEKVL